MAERLPRGLRVGGALLLALAALAILAPWIATDRPWIAGSGPEPLLRAPIPFAPDTLDIDSTFAPPSGRHWLGTDGLGRDVGSRLVHGGRVSLAVGLLSASLALALGLPLGALAGYRGGWTDALVSRVIEAVLCFPSLLLALAVLCLSPPWLERWPDVVRVSAVLGVTGWIPVARYLRGEFLRIRSSDMVVAARAGGAGDLRVIVRHILPSALAPVLVTASFAVGAAILLEAALSFLGLGVRPPVPTWGGMLTEARDQVSRGWWLALFPGLMLFLAVLGCNLVGEGLRDRLDPRARS